MDNEIISQIDDCIARIDILFKKEEILSKIEANILLMKGLIFEMAATFCSQKEHAVISEKLETLRSRNDELRKELNLLK